MTDTDTPAPRKHPAKFSDEIIDVIRDVIAKYNIHTALDPFAGVGKIFDAIPEVAWTGIEIEQEWADQHPLIIHGDSIEVIRHWMNVQSELWQFDAIITSPAYGNRMADQSMLPDRGAGLKYTYNTYAYKLGRVLNDNNGARYSWHGSQGKKYRLLHRKVWMLCVRLLAPGQYIILNVSNYKRDDKIEPVAQWHCDVLTGLGMELVERVPIKTKRNRQGANGDKRVRHEWVYVFRKMSTKEILNTTQRRVT